MQSEASSLQQALHKQGQQTQQAQQACDSWMSNARQQVVRGLSNFYIGSASTAKMLAEFFFFFFLICPFLRMFGSTSWMCCFAADSAGFWLE